MSFPPLCQSREIFEHVLECTSRALAHEPGLTIRFSGQQSSDQSNQLQTSIPDVVHAGDPVAVTRGLCDGFAARVRFHDARLHRRLSPAGPLSRAVYDEFERVRVEALASRIFPGVAVNLLATYGYQYELNGLEVLDSDAAPPMLNAVVLMLHERLLERPLPIPATRLAARWQDEITQLNGVEFCQTLDRLNAACHNQADFARLSSELIKHLELADDPEMGEQVKPAEFSPHDERGEAGIDQAGAEGGQGEDTGQETVSSGESEPDGQDSETMAGEGACEPDKGPSVSVLPFPDKNERGGVTQALESIDAAAVEPDEENQSAIPAPAYHAYTTRYDEQVQARELISKDQLRQLRGKLDQEILNHRQVAVGLANRLKNSLTTLRKRAWTFDLDDGLLDSTRLSRLITDPNSPLVYKQERDSQIRDTVVSFLIDNSGSMRGRPIVLAAMFTEILAQTLERCHITTEILGFTTREWRGGETCRRWRAEGKPADPGRLSDLRHVVYKAADEPWRGARQSLGVMLWPDLLKENIDGEALLWAHHRLNGRPEQRRILVVISDGVAADDATLTANSRDYLDVHLRKAIHWIENKSGVELLAIGTGHDVSAMYQRSVTIANSEQLGDAMAHELVELLGNVPSSGRYPLAINH